MAVALVGVIILVVALITLSPLKSIRFNRVDAFLSAYSMAMLVCDSITAVLLYAQFSILRSHAILALASGYVFTALVLIPFVLAFPGMFVPGGGVYGGLQSASWIWCFWHAGFPAFVIGYALLNGRRSSSRIHGGQRWHIALSILLTAGVVTFASVLFMAGESMLPKVASDALHFTDQWPIFIGAPVSCANALALVIVWRLRRSVLDSWLMAVAFLYVIEAPLTYYPDPSRFSLAWYAVRVIGFLASGLILALLLYETMTMYARLLGTEHAQCREREARFLAGDAVAASIAHEVRQPLAAMVTTADAGMRFLNRTPPDVDRAARAFRGISADGLRAGDVISSIRRDFRPGDDEHTSFDINSLVREALELERGSLQRHAVSSEIRLGERLPDMHGNRVQIQQVLLNLISNALDAMRDVPDPKVLGIATQSTQDGYIHVCVTDTGEGISRQVSFLVFSPLFTTKSHGMGMGLPICRSIIDAHKGRLWFSPHPPRGTAFHFTLPTHLEDVSAPRR